MIQVVEYNKQKLLKSNFAKELYNKLIAIKNDDYWALGIIDELYDNDKKYQKMINIINNGEKDIDILFELSYEM